jgi:hypothetical protein
MNIYLANKYTNWYYQLISKRQNNPPQGYKEKHHIIPRCLGGSDDPSNLIFLTAREHFVAHWLLTKIVFGPSKYKMEHALYAMSRVSKCQERKLSSLEYERCRLAKSIAMKNKISPIVSDPTVREKWYESMKEVNSRPEVKFKRSESAKAFRSNLEIKEKYLQTYSSTEYKEKQSAASKEAQNRPEVKRKKSERAKLNYSKPGIREKYSRAALECQNRPEVKAKKAVNLKSQKYTCPHCNKTGIGPAMFRHHFDRCRNK